MYSQLMLKIFKPLIFSLFSFVPIFAKSTSNDSKPNLAEACPTLSEKPSGQIFGYKLQLLNQPVLANRNANIWYGSEAKILKTKTIIFYWHGTDGVTEEIDIAFGAKGVQNLVERGYIVVSPDHIRNAKGDGVLKYSWYIANGSRLNHDIVFGDLIVDCLNARFNTNFRIITTGCSAGAMQSALWAFQNKDIAGIVLYSGGIFRLPQFIPRENFWSVITHGGAADKRGDFNFMNTAIHIHNQVLKLGYRSALCNFAPQGHDIHSGIANIFTDIITDPENASLPVQCSKEKS